ncbi:MAG: universal stress protein [Putridiphycobacter sp.]|nr:universal stress protein [Putridiphycobacter sp.]
MKTILVPTDFSQNAYKALEYASNLAKEIGAKIVVLNAYQIPPGTSNVMINFADILEKDSREDLAKLMDKLSKVEAFKGIEYIPYSCYGYLVEAIEIASKHHKIDLIVMGTAGASNIKSKIFGSNTLETIRKADYPIVVVPFEVEYTNWENIILASNEDDNILSAVKTLNELIDLNKTNIDIVSVEPVADKNVTDHSELIKNLNGWQYQFHTEKNDNVVDGILKYTNDHQSDIIVLLRKSYGFIERILHTSVTKKLALHSKKPLFLFKGQ